jgi:branched-chain amino acid transport system substrate-binding protein
MSKITKTIIWLIVAIVVIAGIWCWVSKKLTLVTEREPIKIGAILPLTGKVANIGLNEQKGIMLAVEEINRKGGINGRKIEVVFEDSEGDPTKGITAIQKLINVDKIQVVIVSLTKVASAVRPVAEKNKIVMFGESTDTKLAINYEYVFRHFYSNAYNGRELAKFAYISLRKNKAAILYLNTEAGIEGKDAFEEEFKKLGGIIVASEAFSDEETDFKVQLTKIKLANPEVVFLSGRGKTMSIIFNQFVQLGIDAIPLVQLQCGEKSVLEASKDVLEKLLVYSAEMDFNENSSVPIVRNFVNLYRNKYNESPTDWAIIGYDDMQILIKALESGARTSEEIKNRLKENREFNLVEGKVLFDKEGSADIPTTLFKIEKGVCSKI